MLANLVLACSLLSLVPHTNCRQIEDRDRRSFDDRSPILLDVDGDGRLDVITPRVYTVEVGRKAHAGKTRSPRESHRISFSLKTSKGRALDSFFWYEYGDEEVGYWVYAVVPCDINKDGRVDLVFYSGDDTSDETITLLNTGKGFKVHSRKTSMVE